MTLRPFIIAFSVVLPMIIMLAIIYFASDIGKKAAPNEETKDKNSAIASGGMSKVPETLPDTKPLPTNVPLTLEDAKQKANARLEELKKMNQKEWDTERLNVLHRSPPKRIEEAIARAMLRVKDLEAMDETIWQAEKARLIARENSRQEALANRLSEEDLLKEVDVMFKKNASQDEALEEK